MPPKRKRATTSKKVLTPDDPGYDDISDWSIRTTRIKPVKGHPALPNESKEFGTLGDNLRHDIFFQGKKGAWESLHSYKRWNIDETTLEYYVGDYIAILTEDTELVKEEEGAETAKAEEEGFSASSKAAAKKAKQKQKRDKAGEPTKPLPAEAYTEDDDVGGIAKVLECRAIDAEHVYLRIQWLYKPHELMKPYSPQPYYAANEVFPSTHYQLVDATSCNGKVEVVQFEPGMDEDGAGGWGRDGVAGQGRRFCWRQTYDFTMPGSQMSEVETYCVCKKPADLSGDEPDELVRCLGMGSKQCKEWLHTRCLCRQAEKDAEREAANGADGNTSTQMKSKGKLKSLKTKKDEENGDHSITATWDKEHYRIQLTNKRTGTTWFEEDVKCLICHGPVGDDAKKQRLYQENGMA